MQTVKAVGYDIAKIAAHIVMNAGFIPCFYGQSGIGKTSIARDMAQEIGIPEWEANPDHEGPTLNRWLASCMLPEDANGCPVPNLLDTERKTVFAKPEKVLHARNFADINLFDEVDRGDDATIASFIAGFAEKPFQIGGLPLHPEASIIATMNGDTDSGTKEPPEALKQRMFFIPVIPSQVTWLGFMNKKHEGHRGLTACLSDANEKLARSWQPRDYAGEAQRYERSADHFLEVFGVFSQVVAAEDIETHQQDEILDLLGVGKLGCAYWTEVRSRFRAQSWLDRWSLDANEILNDPANASLPPDGCQAEAIGHVIVVTGEVPTETYGERLNPEEWKATQSLYSAYVDPDAI